MPEGKAILRQSTWDGVLIPPCRHCARPNGACSLRCPVLNLQPGWYERSQLEWEAAVES